MLSNFFFFFFFFLDVWQDEAVKEYGREALKIYRSRFTNMYHAMTEHKGPTFMKMITVLPDEKVVGMHMIG